jgi:hypothetical protein
MRLIEVDDHFFQRNRCHPTSDSHQTPTKGLLALRASGGDGSLKTNFTDIKLLEGTEQLEGVE